MGIARTGATLLLISALAGVPAGCRRTPPKLTEQSFELANGLAVDLVAGPCGTGADVVVLYAVGSDHDPAGRSGLVHVLAGAAELAAAGDHTLAARSVSRDELPAALAATAAQMGQRTLTTAEVDRARAASLAALMDRRGGDAAMTAVSYAAEAVRPTRGDGWRGGIAAEIEAITPAELERFWQAHMTPANARLVVVGRFDAKAMRGRIEEAFARVAAGTAPALRPPVEATVTGTLVMGDAPAMVALAVPAPAPSTPTFAGFLVLAARASGPEVTIVFDPLVDASILFVTGALRPGEAPEVAATRVRGALAELLARPLTPPDLAAARKRFGAFLGAGGLDVAGCAADRRGFAVGRARRAQLGIDGAALTRALDALTPAQLAEAAARFDARHTAAVIAGGTIR